MNKIICGLCKKYIDIDKDNYCRLTDYKEGKFIFEDFYHLKCYNDKINLAKDHFTKQASKLLSNILKNVPKNKEQEYIVTG